MNVLVTGATGYVGGCLIEDLQAAGHHVRALARRPEKLRHDVESVRGDVVTGEGLAKALDGIDVAYYLVHSMGRGNAKDFAETDRRAAHTFGAAAAGTRVVYLGGLEGEGTDSAHLQSRHEVATILRGHARDFVYARAAMVIGSGSESFVIMRSLVELLPRMVTPKWGDPKSQPIAIRDVTAALTALADHPSPPDEVQLGGAEVLTYREMMARFATLAGRRPPAMIKVPLLTPRLSSLWVALVTPADRGIALPLVHGLSAEMLVRTPPPPGINDTPLGFDEAVREALA